MKEKINLLNNYFKKSKGEVVPKVDSYVDADLNLALERAKTLIAKEDLSKPFVLRSPNLDETKVRFRLNKVEGKEEHVVDYDHTLVTIIFLGAKKLYYYQGDIDHVRSLISNEVVGEILYVDVVNTEVEVNNEVNRNLPYVSEVNLALTLRTGNELVFNLRTHYLYNEEKYPNILTDDERYIVETIKAAING